MKGIVVETDRRDAVVLTEDGLFVKVKNMKYRAGQTIDTGKTAGRTKWIAAAASMAAVLTISTVGAAAYYTPTDYVSLDVNPSIEYTVNRFDRILDTTAVNEDGKEILDDLDVDHMKLETALKKTLDLLIQEGYLTDDQDSGVVITTSNDEQKDAEQLAKDLKQELQTYLGTDKGITARVDAEAVKPEKLEKARDLGVSPGKLNLVEKLQNSTTGAITMEDWLDRPVKEINKAIKENRKEEWKEEKKTDRKWQSVPTEKEIKQDWREQFSGGQRQDQQQGIENETGDQPVITESGIDARNWQRWGQDKENGSHDNRWNQDRNNGQGNGLADKWLNRDGDADQNHQSFEWVTPGGVEAPGFGNPPGTRMKEDSRSNGKGNNKHSDDEEDQSDSTD